MGTALDLVYQYRQLSAKCDAGAGLDMEEIEVLNTIEALFDRDRGGRLPAPANRREFMREEVDVEAVVRGRDLADPVHIVNLAPGGLVCEDAPYLAPGESVEILIDDHELHLSYRFKGVISWTTEDDHGCSFGIRFVGMPLLVRYGPPSSACADELDQVAA